MPPHDTSTPASQEAPSSGQERTHAATEGKGHLVSLGLRFKDLLGPVTRVKKKKKRATWTESAEMSSAPKGALSAMRSAAADFPTAVGPVITITLGRTAPPPSAVPPRDSPTEPISEVHFLRMLLQNERPPPGAHTACVRLAASAPRPGWPRTAGGGAASRRSPRCTGRGRSPDPAGNSRGASPCLASGAPAPSTEQRRQRMVTPSREREGHAARRHWRICRRHAHACLSLG